MPEGPDYFINDLITYIEKDNYNQILKLLKNPEYSINLYGARNNWTPLHVAIEYNKPALVELFLLMKANPYHPIGGNLTPRMHAKSSKKHNTAEETETIPNAKIIKLFHDPNIVRETTKSNTELDLKEQFIHKIRVNDAKAVEEMINQGFPYNDYQHYEGTDTALGIAIQAGALEIVVKLIQAGTSITDYTIKEWLNNHAHQPGIKPFIDIVQLEKQKQIQMMEVFCKASGTAEEKLEASREQIHNIQKKFDSEVQILVNHYLKGKEWNNNLLKTLNLYPEYPPQLSENCKKMGTLIGQLYQDGALSEKEANHLITLTETLIKDPSTYKNFLAEAKSLQPVAGGKLSAYMLLIAGWAAKIITLGYQGDALIKYATEKLERIDMVEQLSHDSEAHTRNTPV